MTIVRELVTFFGFELDDSAIRRADQAFDGLTRLATRLATAVTAAAGAITLVTTRTAAAIQETDLWATRIGVGVDVLSELDFAAGQAGSSAEDLREALTDLGEKAGDVFLNDPKQTSDAAESFKALGVNIRTSTGQLKDNLTLLLQVSDRLRRLPDAANRTGIAMRLFGDDIGRRLVPFLLLGSEGINELRQQARALGVVLDRDAIQRASEFQRALRSLQSIVQALTRRFTAELLPVMTEVLRAVQSFVIANHDDITAAFRSFSESVRDGVDSARSFIRILRREERAIKVIAGVIATALLPRLAQLVIAQLAAVAIPGLLAAAFLAAAAVIGLILEDLLAFIQGEESALGNLIQVFTAEAQKPGAHWMVRTMALLLRKTGEATTEFGRFAKMFIEDVEEGGLMRALSVLAEGFADDMIKAVRRVGAVIDEVIIDPIARFFDRLASMAQGDIGAITRGVGRLSGLGGSVREALSGAFSLPSPGALAGGISSVISVGDTNISVQAEPGASAQETAQRVRTTVDQAQADQLRRISREMDATQRRQR